MLKAYKYRLNPTKGQEQALRNTLRLCRQLYNAALEERRTAYQKCGVTIGYYEQKRALTVIRTDLPEYKQIHSQVLQNVIERLDKAFKAFFRRVKNGETPGYPRFQGSNRFDSFTFPQAGKTGAFAHQSSGKVTLSGIGNIRCKYHRPLEGNVKTATVKREGTQWFVVFTCEVPIRPLPATNKQVGIDVGVTSFVTTSDGEKFENPRYLAKLEARLRKAQRRLTRRQRGSTRRRKARELVAKLHLKVRRQRLDYHHKVARQLVNKCAVIAHEALNIKGMTRGMLAKAVHDVAWSQFLNILSFKAEEAGRTVVAVDPRHTSQDCSVCGCREEHPLSVRVFTCGQCGAVHDRDWNAARNISARAERSGANVAVVDASVA